MDTQLITFKRYDDSALADALTQLLDQHHIIYEVEGSAPTFDVGFRNNNSLSKDYTIKIKSEDFIRVDKLLKESEAEDIDKVPGDYYLFDFTDSELLEILAKADEWSSFDYQLARKILAQRGVEVNDKMLAAFAVKRIDELKAPDPPQTTWIILGYIFALMGGVLGTFIGWHLAFHKKILPDGERVFGYNDNDRKHGKIIFYLSIIVFALFIFTRIAQIF